MELDTQGDETASETRDVNVNSVQISTISQERHPQANLQWSPSTISFDHTTIMPRTVLDHLEDIYSHRTHRRCIDWSYSTLLSMTIAVFSWIAFWLTSNRCKNLSPPEPRSFLCALVIIFEVITIGAIILIPFFLVLMIRAWLDYARQNPFDSIRQNFIGVKLQDEQWQRQVECYFDKRAGWFSRHSCRRRRRQREELLTRGCGHVIFSPHGIVIDEMAFIPTRSYVLIDGLLMDNRQILQLRFRRHLCPCKHQMEIFLPNDNITQQAIDELLDLLKIPIHSVAILPPRF